MNPPKRYEEHYQLEVSILQFLDWTREMESSNPELVMVDIETKGEKDYDALDPWKATVTGIAFCWKPGYAINISFMGPHDPMWKPVKAFLENSLPKAFHNSIFDDAVLQVSQNIKTQNIIWDTRDGVSIIFAGLLQNLDLQRTLYTSEPSYKKELALEGKKNPHLGYYGGKTHWANCKDVDVQYQVYLGQKSAMSPVQKDLMARLVKYDRIAVKMRIRGVNVSTDNLAIHMVDLQPEVEKFEREFFDKYQVNIASNKQLATLLFDTLALPLPRKKKNKTGYSVDEKTLEEVKKKTFIEDEKVVLDKILEYRGLAKGMSTYVVGVYKLLYPDGKLHPEWVPTGTDTGRWACNSPNLQNQPIIYRDAYIPSPGKEFYIADFSGLEFLIMLVKSGELETAEAMLNGYDPHGVMQAEMNKLFPCSRMAAKIFVFGTAYGMQATTAARDLGVPVHIALAWQEMAFGRYPKLKKMADAHAQQFRDIGYTETMFGRRKYSETVNQAMNSPIQGTAGDICGNAMIALDEAGWDIILQIHDEIICERDIICDPILKQKTLDEYVHIVETANSHIFRRFPVKAMVSSTWEKG